MTRDGGPLITATLGGSSSSCSQAPGATPWSNARLISRPLAARRWSPGSSTPPANVLPAVALPIRVPAPRDLSGDGLEAGVPFLLVVERRDHDMTPLSTLGVEAVLPHHESPDVVVVGVHPRHELRVGPRRARTRHLSNFRATSSPPPSRRPGTASSGPPRRQLRTTAGGAVHTRRS